jgi:S1-C subfamily serine protease
MGTDEEAALDAYSRAVVDAVDAVGAAVVSIAIGHRNGWGQGQGSGVLVAPDGYVLTNAHVVDGAARIEVAMTDGRTVTGRVVGKDVPTDLAVVRVDADAALPFVRVGASKKLRPGQLVVAIGNPLGFQASGSTGVVSSLGRSLRGLGGQLVENLVQHTAPLNPGNSGGPLVDFRAELVGINTAILARAQGMSFAIPAGTVSWVVPKLIADGRVRRAYLGIQGQDRPLEPRALRGLRLEGERGVHVASVERGGPAERAGVRPGDVLVRLGQQRIDGVGALLRRLGDHRAGAALSCEVVRGGELRALEVVPGEAA